VLNALALAQAIVLIVLVVRLLPGRRRLSSVEPLADTIGAGEVSVIVATMNEADRLAPCIDGLLAQDATVREILFVDSDSTDGTQEMIISAQQRDSRVRLLRDEPLPPGWVGKVWALEHGLQHATGEWLLGIDADVAPNAGMVAGALAAARQLGYGAVSFAPKFRVDTPAERWLQPALLVTLVYRCGAAGTTVAPERILANGQCFLVRADVLRAVGGYGIARASFSDDVTLARHLARTGHRVGFLDGSKLYTVWSYSGAMMAWREWGRSLDLADSTTKAAQWWDVALLLVAQGTPLLGILLALWSGATGSPLLVTSGALLAIRVLLMGALRHSYESPGVAFWLSPLADPLAALRILMSTMRRPRAWRGRAYRFEV
jgi:dolichol-phosphate mannosyltransferase